MVDARPNPIMMVEITKPKVAPPIAHKAQLRPARLAIHPNHPAVITANNHGICSVSMPAIYRATS
jgi:hypothetical protein